MKNLLKPTLIALSVALTVPNLANASGIPTVDGGMIKTTITENLKNLQQLKMQYDTLMQQVEEAKRFADDTKRRLEGNWKLGDLVANDDFLNSLPKEAKDVLLNNGSFNLDSLRKTYGLTTDNAELQKGFDNLIRYAERTKQAYENGQKRIKNLEKLKRLADAASTPAQKQDVSNQFAYEQLRFDQEQQALKQLEASIDAQKQIENTKYLKQLNDKYKKAGESFDARYK